VVAIRRTLEAINAPVNAELLRYGPEVQEADAMALLAEPVVELEGCLAGLQAKRQRFAQRLASSPPGRFKGFTLPRRDCHKMTPRRELPPPRAHTVGGRLSGAAGGGSCVLEGLYVHPKTSRRANHQLLAAKTQRARSDLRVGMKCPAGDVEGLA
jgi:hypothetical protein